MDQSKIQELCFQMVLHAGDARQYFIEALRLVRANDEVNAQLKYEKGVNSLTEAHGVEAQFMTMYANDQNIESDILLIHANDHLTMAILVQELYEELIPLVRTVNELKNKI